ncbi:MAG: hypothetical protein KC505_08615, partial [Myxococcales bacterium]|nr:hypothetical protein [Myxococcales bacterium]
SLDGEPRLQVVLSFIMPRSRIILRLPSKFLRNNRLFDRIELLDTLSDGSIEDISGYENKKILIAPAGRKVSIRYFVRGYGDDIRELKSFSAPMIDSKYFQFAGTMALVFPIAFFNGKKIPLKFEWHLSPGYEVFDSFGANKTNQKIEVNAHELVDSVYIGGADLRAYQQYVRGQPVNIIFEGQWDRISDSQFVEVVTRLLEKQREVWNDDNFPYFLISFVALGTGCSQRREARFGGTAHINSFRAYYPSDCPMKPEMVELISHELMHGWIGKKIKVGQVPGGFDGKFFSEGFTDYYGRIMAYRAGLISEVTYFKTLDASLEKYYTSKQKRTKLRDLVHRIYRKGYSTRELENIPYQQGEIMAANLNMLIRKNSNHQYSLDDVMKDLLVQADAAGGTKYFSIEELADAFDRYIPGEFLNLYRKIEHGEELYPPKLSGCSTPSNLSYTSFQGAYSRYIPNTNIYTYRKLSANCARWLK